MPAPASLLLLRHGQSEWNAVRRWQGTADAPLTQLGRQQATEAAQVLAGLPVRFRRVWSSNLSRAAATGRIIAESLGLDEPNLEARLAEAHAGEWEGLTPDLIEEGWPGWLDAHRRPSGFESYDSVVRRVVDVLDEIGRDQPATDSEVTLVVSHSGVIRSLIRHLGGVDGRVPNLGGIWLTGSSIDGATHWSLGDLFDPSGIVLSGVDAPGEEPGD